MHHGAVGADGKLAARDEILAMDDEPGHQELCDREQLAFLKAIQDDDDLTEHLRSAIDSLSVVLAADRSIRTGQSVSLA